MADEQEIARIAREAARQQVDEILPEKLKATRQAMHLMIAGHNTSAKAHDSAAVKVNRILWSFAGITGLVGLIATLKAIFF